jgi:competence protein ComEC
MGARFRLPLIPVFLSYTLGLYLGGFDPPFPSIVLILSLLSLFGLWGVMVLTRKAVWGSWISLAFFFLLGLLFIHTYLHPRLSSSHISRFIGIDRLALEGTLDRSPERSPEGAQLYVRPSRVILSDRHISVNGPVLLFAKESGPFRLGDRFRFICRLESPHGFHNPGGFSYERHLAFERIYAIGFLSEKHGWVKIGEGFKNPLLLQIERWRDRIREFLDRETPPPSSALLKAFVLGERGDIPDDIAEQFTVTGIAHLLAISGDHLGIVAFLSFSLLIWVLKRSEFLLLSVPVKKWAAGLTVPCLLLYTFIAGGGISLVRAAIMVILFFLSILLDRERSLLHTLALAAFLILILSPPSLFDVSFQLSFLAVLSILYLIPRVSRIFKKGEIPLPHENSRIRTVWRYVRLSLLVTAVATLGTAPWVALHFNRISPLGLVTNLFIIPWVGFLIVPMALTASLFSFFLTPLAVPLIRLDGLLMDVLLRVVSFFASLPGASVFVSTPTPFEIILFYLLLFLAVHLQKGRKVRLLFLSLCLIFFADAAFWSLKGYLKKNLSLTFIDVGQGDSILVEFPGGQRMLVDGGGLREDRFDIGQRVIAPFLWKKKIHRIDYLVLTHPDPDHLKGLNYIASHFRIGQFWENGHRVDSEPYRRLEATLLRRKITRLSLHERDPLREIGGVVLHVLNPPTQEQGAGREPNLLTTNNRSLVLRLQFKNRSFLLAGDIAKEAEARLLREGYSLEADLLKIPHHGSSSSSAPPFLERVKPDYAILTVSERNIGRLPDAEVMERYGEQGVKVFRTDRHGAITVHTDGDKMEVLPFRESSTRRP